MKNKYGFTLVEVLVAVGIFAGGIVLVASMWSGSLMRVRKTDIYDNAAMLLKRKMTEIKVKYKDESLKSIPEEESGDFGSDFPRYRWTLKSRNLEMPNMAPILTAQREGPVPENLISMIKKTSQFISKSVKEVTVSVTFTNPQDREVTYDVTTYFVRYDRPLNLSGGVN